MNGNESQQKALFPSNLREPRLAGDNETRGVSNRGLSTARKPVEHGTLTVPYDRLPKKVQRELKPGYTWKTYSFYEPVDTRGLVRGYNQYSIYDQEGRLIKSINEQTADRVAPQSRATQVQLPDTPPPKKREKKKPQTDTSTPPKKREKKKPKRWLGDDPEHKKQLERELAEEQEQRRREEMRRKYRQKYIDLANHPPEIEWFDLTTWVIWVDLFRDKEVEKSSYEKWKEWYKDHPNHPGAKYRRDQELITINRHTGDFNRVMKRLANRKFWPSFVFELKALEGELEAGKLVEAITDNPIRGYEALIKLVQDRINPGSGIVGAYQRFPPPYTHLWRNVTELRDAFARPLTAN